MLGRLDGLTIVFGLVAGAVAIPLVWWLAPEVLGYLVTFFAEAGAPQN